MSQETMGLDHSEKLLKAVDVARILNVSRAFSYRLLQQGEIPVVRINRVVRVRPADLERYIQRCLTDHSDYYN